MLSEESIVVNEWQGHDGQVTCAAKIEKPLGLITGSVDKHVRVWSLYGEMWVDLTIIGKNPIVKWDFPYDWNEVKEKDKNEVITVMKEIEPGSDSDLSKIQFDDEEPVKVQTTERPKEVPKIVLRHPIATPANKKTARKTSRTSVREELWRMKLRGDKTEPGLVQDVVALVDIYRNASAERKKEIIDSMGGLRDKLRKPLVSTVDQESQHMLSHLYMSKAKQLTSSKKKDLLPTVYLQPKQDNTAKKNLAKQKTALSYFVKPTQITPLTLKANTPRRRDICAIKAYSKKSANTTPKPFTASGSRTQSLVCRNVRFAPGEVEREMLLATCKLPLKKQSNISNYNQADNLVLQQQVKMINKFVKTARISNKKS